LRRYASVMNNLRKGVASLITFGVSISTIPLFAQTSGMSSTLLLAMGANAKRVVQYEWKQRITVIRKGKPSQPVIDQVSFDSAGQMQRTTISAPEPETGGIRGRIAAGVKQDVKEVMHLAARYNKPQQMIEAVEKGRISQSPNASTIRLEANDLIKPGDALTMLINSKTHLATHVDIKTDYDGGPMTISQDYGQLPNGPNVMKSMKVSVPKKDIVVNAESYDYIQQTAREH
jgi:hypothetical protein